MDESVGRIAARIKDWRREANLSLQQLADRSGVSPSTIHKIEHRQTVPTVAVVLKLAGGLGRRAVELFDDAPAVSSATHVRAGDRREATTAQGVVLQTLSDDIRRRQIAVWRVVHPPGFSFDRMLRGRANELVIYVEQGCLRVEVDDDVFGLEVGDALHFETSSPHAWRNDGPDEAVAVLFGNATDAARPGLLSRLRGLALEPEPNTAGARRARPRRSVAASA